eukprot:jgi/Mesen1/9948/ME000071S09371
MVGVAMSGSVSMMTMGSIHLTEPCSTVAVAAAGAAAGLRAAPLRVTLSSVGRGQPEASTSGRTHVEACSCSSSSSSCSARAAARKETLFLYKPAHKGGSSSLPSPSSKSLRMMTTTTTTSMMTMMGIGSRGTGAISSSSSTRSNGASSATCRSRGVRHSEAAGPGCAGLPSAATPNASHTSSRTQGRAVAVSGRAAADMGVKCRAMRGAAEEGGGGLPSAAYAIAAAIAAACSTHVNVERGSDSASSLLRGGLGGGPSDDFFTLCQAQLELCSKHLAPHDLLTVYIRVPESYASGRLELQRMGVFCRQEHDKALITMRGGGGGAAAGAADTIVLSANADADAAFAGRSAVELPERRALVVPLARSSFVLGLLVCERRCTSAKVAKAPPQVVKAVKPVWPPPAGTRPQASAGPAAQVAAGGGNGAADMEGRSVFSRDEQEAAAGIALSLACACIMEQRSLLLQQTTWQRAVHMDSLLEKVFERLGPSLYDFLRKNNYRAFPVDMARDFGRQLLESVRGPLSALRTLGRMLLPQLRRGGEEQLVSSELVEDMLEQGNSIKDTVRQLQSAVYPSSSSSSSTTTTMSSSSSSASASSAASSAYKEASPWAAEEKPPLAILPPPGGRQQLLPAAGGGGRDREMPMPPLALAPLQDFVHQAPLHSRGGCDAVEVVAQLLKAGQGIARQRELTVHHILAAEGSVPRVAADAMHLRQALSNVLDPALHLTAPGGWVRVEVAQAPGGGVLVLVEDNGPGCCLLSQEDVLVPLGSSVKSLSSMAVNAGEALHASQELSMARDLVEDIGGVLRMQSPHLVNAPFGYGGTRVELWLPAIYGDGQPVAAIETPEGSSNMPAAISGSL